jgi:hypothetical protein
MVPVARWAGIARALRILEGKTEAPAVAAAKRRKSRRVGIVEESPSVVVAVIRSIDGFYCKGLKASENGAVFNELLLRKFTIELRNCDAYANLSPQQSMDSSPSKAIAKPLPRDKQRAFESPDRISSTRASGC